MIKINYTNKNNLPQEIVEAVKNDEYSKGDADFSVTELLMPPQKRWLINNLDVTVDVDVSEKLYALFGSAIHAVLNRARTKNLKEHTMFMDYMGYKIKGTADLITMPGGDLHDYKMCSVWEYIYGFKKDKYEQANIYSLMAEAEGLTIRNLYLVTMFRDWQKSKAKYEKNYPREQMMVVSVPYWDREEVERFMGERVKLHTDNPRECTQEERWAKPDKYAVMKSGNKKAVKLHEDYEVAYAHCDRLVGSHYIEKRPAESPHCMEYCVVADHCPQWQELKLQYENS